MPKNKINYQGGQYFFVMIPEISYFQWHPFSVYSSSYEKDIVIFVKVLGDWTTMLYRISGEPGEPEQFPGYIDGPYGLHSISLDGDKYQNFLCVSGGIGVTPIISTAKELLFQMEQGRPISSLQFIWTGRDSCIVNSIFKPDELKQALNTNDHKILQEYYHLSNNNQSMQQLEQDQNSNKSNDIEKGTATSLSSQRKRNRIQFSKFFKYAFDQAKKNKNSLVGVLTCGPQQLINTCELYAQVFSKDGIRFDVHQEVFDF